MTEEPRVPTSVGVTQADRDAAADLARMVYGNRIANDIADGTITQHHFLDAFAAQRHRLASGQSGWVDREEAVRLCEDRVKVLLAHEKSRENSDALQKSCGIARAECEGLARAISSLPSPQQESASPSTPALDERERLREASIALEPFAKAGDAVILEHRKDEHGDHWLFTGKTPINIGDLRRACDVYNSIRSGDAG